MRSFVDELVTSQRDHQQITQTSCLLEIADVPDMQKIKHTVTMHNKKRRLGAELAKQLG